GVQTCALPISLLFAAWRWTLRMPAARLAWHERVLHLPLAGRYVLGVNTARYAATLAILTNSGVSLLPALEAAQRTLSNERLRAASKDAIKRVREGSAL